VGEDEDPEGSIFLFGVARRLGAAAEGLQADF
jgi:hypothetical protein